jgi:SAM-dependent methyltransferase
MPHTLSLSTEAALTNPLAQLPYFVHWRPRLWCPAVRWLLGDPQRFQGKKVLDVGSRTGRMATLFGLLGAEVVGVDLEGVSLDGARAEAARWGVEDRVRFVNYSGNPADLPEGDFDFAFTKSVLVMIPQLESFLTGLAQAMRPGGELLATENLAGSWLHNLVRRLFVHRKRTNFFERFRPVDDAFLATLGRTFELADSRRYYWLVTALRARCRG